MSKINEIRLKLEEDLLEELFKYNLNLIPEDLVKVSAALLAKMYSETTEYSLIKIIGFGSIWAWSFDEIADDPTIPKHLKKPFLDQFFNMLNPHDLKKVNSLVNIPKTGELMVDCINGLLEYKSLNLYERAFLRKEYLNLILGAKYEVEKMGELVEVEESLFHRSYSYATPFYGALLLLGDFTIANWDDFWLYSKFLYVKGRVTRIMNDIATYEKEKGGDEVNLVYALMQEGNDEQEALAKSQKMFEVEYNKFMSYASKIDKNFFDIENKFVDVHNEAYKIKNIREINPDNIKT